MTILWRIPAFGKTKTYVTGPDSMEIEHSIPQFAMQENLVSNPDFADGSEAGWRRRVDGGSPIIEIGKQDDWSYAAKITCLNEGDSGRWLYRDIDVSQDDAYLLSAIISGAATSGMAKLVVTFWNETNEYVGSAHAVPAFMSESPSWQIVRTGAIIPPETSTTARVELRFMDDNPRGSVAFQNITFGPGVQYSIDQVADMAQLIQFNPDAALQKRIFADGFVPNSQEIGCLIDSTLYVVQRAEHLDSGEVRAYYAKYGDWEHVGYKVREK